MEYDKEDDEFDAIYVAVVVMMACISAIITSAVLDNNIHLRIDNFWMYDLLLPNRIQFPFFI